MSLLDDVKILTTPNAYKAGVLYSIKPDTGAADLDVTRSTTATRVDSSGIVETVAVNEPQLDYTGSSCPSFLMEPQITNLVSRSVDFSWGGYFFSNASVTDSSIVSPDTGANASTITTTSTTHYMFTEVGATAGNEYTFSFYAKRGTMTDMKYAIYSWNASAYIISPTSYYSQTSADWARISVTFTVPVGTNTVGLRTLDDSGVTGTVSLWGLQLEKLGYATSFIPTVSANVTRNATTFVKTGLSSLIGQSEGVFFVEIQFFEIPTAAKFIGIGQWAAGNHVSIGGYSSGQFSVFFYLNGTPVILPTTLGAIDTNFHKIAFKYKSGDNAVWLDGVEIYTSTATGTPGATAMDTLSGKLAAVLYAFEGKIKQMQVYDAILTDVQLLGLTT